MSDASIIDEIEGHYEAHHAGTCGRHCRTDFEPWPCRTQRMVAEVQRLRRELAEAQATIRAFVA